MKSPTKKQHLTRRGSNVRAAVEAHLGETGGLLRLAPNWVPRSFLHPGFRLRLHPQDIYACGLQRGGIDERWFGSTTETANEGRDPDEGLSYVVAGNECFTLRDAVADCGATIVGKEIWERYGRWPVYSKFFDNMGMIPHHLHQDDARAALVGQEGKPESYYFPPQYNPTGNRFPYTFMGLDPSTTRDQVRRCIERWDEGDNGILHLSKAHQLEPGTGWLIDPRILHAPGSLCTYEPQWGSDVFAMYQNVIEGRVVPWDLLVKDMPAEHKHDIDFIVDQIDWDKNVDPDFKAKHFLEPVVAGEGDGWVDKWIVYGRIDGRQLFTAKELTIAPGATATIRDPGAYSLILVQGHGRANQMTIASPAMLRFDDLSNDEFFATAEAAQAGVRFENLSSTEPLVGLRYFGPEACPGAPEIC